MLYLPLTVISILLVSNLFKYLQTSWTPQSTLNGLFESINFGVPIKPATGNWFLKSYKACSAEVSTFVHGTCKSR